MKKIPAFDTLRKRTVSGMVIAVVVIGAILLSPYSFAALLMGICVFGVKEFYSLAEKGGTHPQKRYGITVAAIAVAVNFLIAADHFSRVSWLAMVCLLVLFFGIFVKELYRKEGNALINISVTVGGIMYVALPLSILAHLAMFPSEGVSSPSDLLEGEGSYRRMVLLAYVFIVWANDVGAYLVGVLLGKHKLFERISPKKSWEGFFGGLLFAVALGAGCAMVKWVPYPESGAKWVFWIGLSVLIVVSGVMGDLVESMLKRSADTKDSGDVIPGHGGILDRFDALIFSAPFVYVYFVIFAF